MKTVLALALASITSFTAIGCAVPASSVGENGADETAEGAQPNLGPLAMPAAVVSFEQKYNWGMHHLEWHTERQWDLLDKSDLAYAKKQGWTRAAIQEGAPGNGYEFLMMHRAMLSILRKNFPADAALFAGWTTPPTDSNDKENPVPAANQQAVPAAMLTAIDNVMNHVDTFDSEDDLGVYIETNLRPVAGNPSATSTDPSTGLHNYLHNRFSDSNSPIDMGDPTVNIENMLFWRLHGWIDARWTAYRAAKGISDSDATYAKALSQAEMMMTMAMKSSTKATLGAAEEASEPPPASLCKFFENEPFTQPAAATDAQGDDDTSATPSGDDDSSQ